MSRHFLGIFLLLAPIGCESSSSKDDGGGTTACDTSKTPLVFVHGTVGSGDNFNHPALLLASNGYCVDSVRAIEYNSLGGGYADVSAQLDALIPEVLADTGAEKVVLLGHSQGTRHAGQYVSEHPEIAEAYIHLAGGPLTENPGGVRTLSLASKGDAITKGCCDNSATVTRSIVFDDTDIDHFAVAASTESFVEIYKFLNDDEEPRTTEVQPEDHIVVQGRAVTFPDSQVVVGAKIEVYELTDAPRDRTAPVATFTAPESGQIGPFDAKPGASYEFKMLSPNAGVPPRHLYVPPFKRSDKLLRFLFASSNAAVSGSTQAVNYSDEHAVIVARHKRGAFLHGRDELAVNGTSVLDGANSAAANTVVGFYMYDASLTDQDGPGNGATDGGAIISGAFIGGADVFMSASGAAFIEVTYNGQTIRVPNWRSATEGLSLVFFD